MDDLPDTAPDFASFTFHAHVVNTNRETTITIRVRDTEDRSYADMADEAEERAYQKAAAYFRVDVSDIEVMGPTGEDGGRG